MEHKTELKAVNIVLVFIRSVRNTTEVYHISFMRYSLLERGKELKRCSDCSSHKRMQNIQQIHPRTPA